MRIPDADLAGKQVLVTGGTGFIGGRLVERLVLDCNANVRVLVSSVGNLSRIARLPIDIVQGDVTTAGDAERAAAGCDIIFHCAYGNKGSEKERRRITVQGTENVLTAARKAASKRVVHVSTMMVYGKAADSQLDETAARRYMRDWYPDSKIDAEKLVFDHIRDRAVPATVVQPTVVYGPYSPPFTVGVLNRLKRKRIILVDGGDGLCNAVYIDDLVTGMLLAAVKDEAVGEAFLISGEAPVTWREFFAKFEEMLGVHGTVSMSAPEARAFYRQTEREKWAVRQLLKMVSELTNRPRVRKRVERFPLGRTVVRLGERLAGRRSPPGNDKPIHPLLPYQIDFYQAKTHVRIDKAKRLLGYQPAFDLEAGMALTERWAEWANLLYRGYTHSGGPRVDGSADKVERHHTVLQRL